MWNLAFQRKVTLVSQKHRGQHLLFPCCCQALVKLLKTAPVGDIKDQNQRMLIAHAVHQMMEGEAPQINLIPEEQSQGYAIIGNHPLYFKIYLDNGKHLWLWVPVKLISAVARNKARLPNPWCLRQWRDKTIVSNDMLYIYMYICNYIYIANYLCHMLKGKIINHFKRF